jgi:gliding motility-associated-like protein
LASGGTGSYTYSWSPVAGTTPTLSGLAAGTYTCTIQDGNGCSNVQTYTLTTPAPISISTSPVNVKCNGSQTGTIGTIVSGGTGAGTYTYSWTPAGGNASSASGLGAGTYSCTVTDGNACTQTAVVTLTEPAALNAVMSSTDASCGKNNGSALANVTGGTGSYTYSWSPSGGNAASASGLPSGAYACTVTDSNGCSITTNINVNQPTSLTATSSQTSTKCNGDSNGSATAIVNGGAPAYTYSWTPAGGTAAVASGLTAGTYTCNISDSLGCTYQLAVIVTQPAVLSSTGSMVSSVSCQGGSNGVADVTVTGGTPSYKYSWSPSGGNNATTTGLAAGTYSCTVTDSMGCASISSAVIITEPFALTSSITAANPTCGLNNGSVIGNPAGGTAPYQYSWTPFGGSGNTATGLAPGTYTCTITDANGCQLVSTAVLTNTGTPVSAHVAVSGPLTFCSGGNVILVASGGTTYSWSNGVTKDSLVVTSSGTYSVTVSNGCGTADTSIQVVVNSVPVAVISGNKSICAGDSTLLAASGGNTYSWSNGMTSSSIYVSAQGTYSVTAYNSCGSSTTQVTVNVNQVTVSCVADTTSGYAAFTVHFSSTSSPSASTWSWNFGDSTTASGATATHTYTSSGTFTAVLTVTDSNGCQARASVLITVSDIVSWIIIPNVFTPNDDGVNDLFQISSMGITDFNLKIFDRWGVEIAELIAPNQGWDGRTSGGVKVSNGTYYYILKANASDKKSYNLTGFFMLIH